MWQGPGTTGGFGGDMLSASEPRLPTVNARLRICLFLLFVLIAWFPEFSQLEDAHSAEDVRTIYNYRPIGGITASVFDYAFAAVVLIWMAKCVLPRPKGVLHAPLARYMLTLLAVWSFNLIHGLVRGNEAYYALREFRCQAYFVLAFLMVVTVWQSPGDGQRFTKLLIAMAAIVGGYGVGLYSLGIGKEFLDHVMIYYDISDSIVLYSAMLVLGSFAAEGGIGKGKAFLATILTVPIVFTFLFSYRRGAWVGFLAGLLFFASFYPGRARMRRMVLRRVLMPAFGVILLIFAVPSLRRDALDFVVDRVYSVADVSEDSSNIFRILDARNALNSFIHHPLIGVGAGGRYDLEFTSQQVLMSFMEEVNRTSHNGYLYVLFKAGIVGFVAYLAVYAKFLRQWFLARKRTAGPADRRQIMACGAIVVAILVNNMTETMSDLLRPSLLLAFVMGWGAVLIRDIQRRAGVTSQRLASRRGASGRADWGGSVSLER